ncbi:MAG TPA: hypothetical protein VNO79_02680 [Actinomycetota bacterium]|nr:hypothetical protein [Actinomycetota bacterium]
MGDRIRCFMLEPTGRERLSLRRYSARSKGGPCPGEMGYHDARAVIGEARDEGEPIGDTHPHDDPRWPSACACGYVFAPDDHWQLFREDIYRRADTGEEVTLGEAPPGAMWYADWMGRRGPDGHCLAVKLPGGFDWLVDYPAMGTDQPWQRTGTPPDVTASPSIGVPDGHGGYRYHGFLRAGWLEEV